MSDLFEAMDQDLGSTGLMNQLLQATNGVGRTSEAWSSLVESVRGAFDRLRSR